MNPQSRRRPLTWILMVGGAVDVGVGAYVIWQALHPNTWRSPIPGILFCLLGVAAFLLGLRLWLRTKVVERSTPATFLTADEETKVLEAIAAFEKTTSGELRVHLEPRAGADIMAAARQTFEALGLTATRQRNAVLFFICVSERRFAVLGDSGIDSRVPPDFWKHVVATVEQHFRSQHFAEGLISGIQEAGEALTRHFPPTADDVDELPNSLSRGL